MKMTRSDKRELKVADDEEGGKSREREKVGIELVWKTFHP